MNPFEKFREQVLKQLAGAVDVPGKDIDKILEKPPEGVGADLALPCFFLAARLKKDPRMIAVDVVNKAQKKAGKKLIANVKAVGPYVNFYANWDEMNLLVLRDILKLGSKYGSSREAVGKRVMVEYSSPNTNKPLHLGHLRNGALGMAISNILEKTGHKVIKALLFNNRGIHISKSMIAYQKFGKGKKPGKTKPDHFVGDFYTLFNKKGDEKLLEEARELLKKWESGDKETKKLWKQMDDWAVKGFNETYKRFGSEFDAVFKESDFYTKADSIIKLGKKKGVFKEEDGALIVNLEEKGLSKKVLVREDGTNIYVTNDLILTKHKFDKYRLDKSIWLVGSEQDFYFRQLFEIFRQLGFRWAGNCMHMKHGLVNLPEGRMKSREGKVVEADDIIDEMHKLARKEIAKRAKLSKKELEKRADAIGLGAIKYYLLKVDYQKDMSFNPEESISFEGDTGPYIQYSHARASSILRKVKGKAASRSKSKVALESPTEVALMKHLAAFPETVARAARDFRPHYITNYAFELATKFNDFYEKCPVIKANTKEQRTSRLSLVRASKIVLGIALNLLGIDAPERM
jgi:arginyl-tRNA synthetase